MADKKSTTAKAKRKPSKKPRPPVGDEFESVLYTTSKWKGLPNYECMFCGFATVDHDTALEHASDAHAPPEPKIIDTGLVTESGAPITRAVEPAKED